MRLLAEAFDGTAQRGATLPIFYDEYGVETRIPAPKARLYTGKEGARTKPVDEATQAAYYREALELAFCQPNVAALLFFHVVDEPQLDRWQSGLYFAGGTPKPSLRPVRDAVRQTNGGVVAHCPGLRLAVKATVAAPRADELGAARVPFRLTCQIDCAYSARLERVMSGRTVVTAEGQALAKVPSRVRFPAAKVHPGLHRVVVKLVAPVNPGTPIVRKTTVFRIR